MNATAPTLAQTSRTRASTTFSVDVVDGNGLDVAAEPVTALIRHGDGSETVVRQTTDTGGRARFLEEQDAIEVVVMAGREVLGPLRPSPGAHLVIEM